VSVDATIQVLKHANGLRAVQNFLTGLGLRSGVGWDQIRRNLEEHIESQDLTADDLHDFVIDVHSRAHKLVSLYKISKKNYDALWEMAKGLEDEETDDLGFPWLLDKDELTALDETPQHVYTRKTENGYELFFTSARNERDAKTSTDAAKRVRRAGRERIVRVVISEAPSFERWRGSGGQQSRVSESDSSRFPSSSRWNQAFSIGTSCGFLRRRQGENRAAHVRGFELL